MFLIVGLGNPGKKYENNRHNIGFMAIDYLAERNDIRVDKLKFDSLYGEGRIAGEKVILLKPQTYMNNSGQAVQKVASYFKIKEENIMVIVDDIDIEPFTLRIRKKGGPGTHNGMKSIVSHLGSKNFPRIKLGVGKNTNNLDLADFVLSDFPKKDKQDLEECIYLASQAVEEFILNGIEKSMNKYN